MEHGVDFDKAPGRYVIKPLPDGQYYWYAYIGDVRVNGGLADSYSEGVYASKYAIAQCRRRWRYENFYWDVETTSWVKKGELPPV